ncbi:hypothetical protein SAMN05216206_2806 [Pseudomonas guineae]|uniref:Uncharacterized protein n=1 Tax=Pseudomonas guineae TaxID=425504 RepID=A0A1I3KF73_9PSED|nr:hypothetical protein [Pseudomonas guineae]SFI71146.1 hypothetical protein SAMN05216206_2806 [Pseudomonas guineae]
MGLEDKLTLLIAGGALFISVVSLYFSTLHKPAGAVLNLVERTFSPSTIRLADRKQISPQMRHLVYTLSNTGSRTLFIRSVCLLRGPNALGYYHSYEPFHVVKTNHIEPFVLPKDEVRMLQIDHTTDYLNGGLIDKEKNHKELISVEVIGANGHRYLVVHDISRLGSTGPEIHDPIWDGVTLGRPVRENGYV